MVVTNSYRASERVFGINELLENILSHLRMKDLLHAQQACQQWRTVIAGSKFLRRHLFLEPELGDIKPLNLSPIQILQMGCDVSYEETQGAHPFLEDVFLPCEYDVPRRYILIAEEVKRILFSREGGWVNTFILQPPPRKVQIEYGGSIRS